MSKKPPERIEWLLSRSEWDSGERFILENKKMARRRARMKKIGTADGESRGVPLGKRNS